MGVQTPAGAGYSCPRRGHRAGLVCPGMCRVRDPNPVAAVSIRRTPRGLGRHRQTSIHGARAARAAGPRRACSGRGGGGAWDGSAASITPVPGARFHASISAQPSSRKGRFPAVELKLTVLDFFCPTEQLQESTHSGWLESTYNGPRLRRWTSHLVGKSPVALLNDLSGRLPYRPASLRLQARS
jgi:hypothetical protein